ncbi:hypothetical protein U1Q18_023176 [Sarracenia purpurea var. burkii]
MGDPTGQVVGPLVKTVLGTATTIITQKYQLLQGVEEDVKILSSKLSAIQSVLEDAEEKQLDNKQLRDWLGKLKDAAYDSQDILESFATDAWLWQKKNQDKLFKPPISAGKIDYKLKGAHEIKDILKRIGEIADEKDQFHLNASGYLNPPPEIRRTSSLVFEADVVGRDDDKNKIVEILMSEEFDREGEISCLPIVGMGGLGKTTLAQFVYNDDRIKDHFEFRMWVCVTLNFDFRTILKGMIQYHTEMKYDINSLSNSQLQSRLLEFLAGKKFLLVLDDVWDPTFHDLEQLLVLLKRGGKGCKVLVTSRNTQVSKIMGTIPPYLLEILPYEQCWTLFEKIAFKRNFTPENDRSELEEIGREIVKKCNGLPLAVKAMGGLLAGDNDLKLWKRILKHEIWEAEAHSANPGKPIVQPALKLSYDHLPSHLKQCFAYCYVFPKAYVFDKIELVKFWKAQSFIHPRGAHDTIDDVGLDYFDDLLMRSFFQLLNIDNKQRYRMHDLMHDLAMSVSIPHCCQIRESDLEPCQVVSESSRHVSILSKEVEKPILEVVGKSKRLRTLLLPSEHEKPIGQQALGSLFQSLKYVRTLDLSSTTMEELPGSVEEMKLLCFLDLSKTDVKALPDSICNLYNLQTLKLLGCVRLFELPKSLGNLVKLEHLELDDLFWFKSSSLPPKLGSLKSLQNLHAFHVGRESGYGIEELKEMNCLNGTLRISKLENVVNAAEANLKDKEGLNKLVFEWSKSDPENETAADNEERVLEDLQPHSNLRILEISHYQGTRLSSWMRDGMLRSVTNLTLNRCSKCKVLNLGQLGRLMQLNIKGMMELEEWPEAEYPSLQRLNISNCPKLRILPSFFPSINSMKIKKCDSLKALPVAPVTFLILVENAALEDWSETLLQVSFRNDQGQIGVNMQPSFWDLIELTVVNCPKLEALPRGFAPQKLDISMCPLLRTLPIPALSRRLQHLAIDGCQDGTLVRAIPETNSMYSLVISNISGLTRLPKLPNLPGLKALHIRGCSDLVSLSEQEEGESSLQGAPALTLLTIRDCPRLEKLPEQGLTSRIECLSIGSCKSLGSLGPKDVLKNLTSLMDLYIDDCPELESLPEEGIPASLQHLHIEGCPLLLKKCRRDGGPDWEKIANIPDLELVPMEASPTRILAVKKPPSGAWYRHLVWCKGGTSKGKMVQ